MMKNTIYRYISSTCVVFTFVMLFTSLFNCFQADSGSENKMFWQMILLFLLVVCVVQCINFFISRWDFKSNMMYHIVNFTATFISSFLIFYLANIMSFSIHSLVTYTIIYTFIYVLLHYYFTQKNKLQADEINKMLQTYKEHL